MSNPFPYFPLSFPQKFCWALSSLFSMVEGSFAVWGYFVSLSRSFSSALTPGFFFRYLLCGGRFAQFWKASLSPLSMLGFFCVLELLGLPPLTSSLFFRSYEVFVSSYIFPGSPFPSFLIFFFPGILQRFFHCLIISFRGPVPTIPLRSWHVSRFHSLVEFFSNRFLGRWRLLSFSLLFCFHGLVGSV